MIETIIYYATIYGFIAFGFSLLYAFLYGMVERTWRIRDLLPGLFFPWSTMNELGNLVQKIIMRFITEKSEDDPNENKAK